MYYKKSNKVCPFCQSKVKKVMADYKCENCGAIIKQGAFDTKSLNSNFFNGLR